MLAVALAGLTAVPTSAADGEMCQGKPATIVQSDGDIKGTDGDDVIIGGRTTQIFAGKGEDTVCVPGGFVNGGSDRDSVEVRGTEDADVVVVRDFEVADIAMGGGPDRVNVVAVGDDFRMDGLVDGGAGADVLVGVNLWQDTFIDLADGVLTFRQGKDDVTLAGFENSYARAAYRAEVVGDGGDNRLSASTWDCSAVVWGGAGDDVISAPYIDGRDPCTGLQGHGQRGDDVLLGSYSDDILIGGPGRDRAVGGPADAELDLWDVCRAEVRRRCELRRPPY